MPEPDDGASPLLEGIAQVADAIRASAEAAQGIRAQLLELGWPETMANAHADLMLTNLSRLIYAGIP